MRILKAIAKSLLQLIALFIICGALMAGFYWGDFFGPLLLLATVFIVLILDNLNKGP